MNHTLSLTLALACALTWTASFASGTASFSSGTASPHASAAALPGALAAQPARQVPAPGSAALDAQAVPEQLRLFLERETTGFAGRIEVTIGAPGSRLQLAPCANPQPFVPAGARLWGRTTLGVRCAEGATWQVFLPVHIKVFGQAPVAARPLNAGDSVSEADLRFEEIELTRYPAGAFADPGQLADKQLARPLSIGQPLLRESLRARPVLAPGDTVKLVYSGQGFSVSTQARTLSAALDGQSVRVVTEAGKTISGIARPNRVVELKF